MAGSRIKGITVEIGGYTTKLQSALKGVNSEIKNTQSQLKDVEKLLKLDPGNTELLAQKQKLLSSAVSETKETKIDKIQPSLASKKKLRVAAYCRVSTDSDAQLESLDAQKEHYKNHITSRDDWTFAGLYFDEGITGTKADKRPILLRLIEDCKAKKIDFVITKSISRLSRNTTDCLEIVRTLLSLDIPIYFEKENINTGSMESELFLSILSSMAEGESASISENNKWSIKKRFLDGTYKLGYMPYGYCWKDGEILVDPAQAEIVKHIFRELLSGKGTEAIAKELNQEQVPTKNGGRWTSTSIRDIIRNEKYTGDCIFQKTYTDSNFNRHKNDGHLDQYYVPDHHEAIISHENFEAAAALFRRISSYGCRKSWYADEWAKPAPMAKSAPTAATTALHRLSFAANAVKCSVESTGTIAVTNPSSGAASAGWSLPGRNATQELSMRRYWRMW